MAVRNVLQQGMGICKIAFPGGVSVWTVYGFQARGSF